MCLAVPGNIIAFTSEHSATVDMMGVQREISTALTPDAQVGDYVLIHAGFSIQVISPEEARQTIEIFQEIPELVGEELDGIMPLGTASAAFDGTASETAPTAVPAAEPATATAEA